MGSSNKSGRRLTAVQCHEVVAFVESAKRFQRHETMLRRLQEDAMYKAYRAELASIRERQEDEALEAYWTRKSQLTHMEEQEAERECQIYWAQEDQKALIQKQEDAMLKAYRFEKARTKSHQEDEMLKDHLSKMELEEQIFTSTFPLAPCYLDVGCFARFWVTNKGNKPLYPTSHTGNTSKSKRYHPTEKRSDQGKFHGRPKGRSFRKLKMEGPSVVINDLI